MTPFGLTPLEWHLTMAVIGFVLFCLFVILLAGKITDGEGD